MERIFFQLIPFFSSVLHNIFLLYLTYEHLLNPIPESGDTSLQSNL